MSQWGANDAIVLPALTVDLDGVKVDRASGSMDFTGDTMNVGDVIQIAGVGGAAVINSIASATSLRLVSNTSLSKKTASGANVFRLSTMPKDLVVTLGTAANTVLGVDTTEQTVDVTAQQSNENNREISNTAAHAGWVKVGDLYTDSNSNVRRKNETLVAMSSIAGDASDDVTLPDS